MATIEFPTTPQDISADWLTDVLRQSGVIAAAAVKEVDVQTIAVGQGFTTQIGRLTVQYDTPDSQAPRSIVAKVPTLYEPTRQAIAALGVYEREVRFYEQLAPYIPLRVPRCYFSALDSETGNFVLLLEDLTTTAISRQMGTCSLEEADFVLRHLAVLHAAWWEAPKLDEFSWIPQFNFRAQQNQEAYFRLWPVFLDKWGAFIPEEMQQLGELIGKHIPYVQDYLAQAPRTLIHGDFRLDNMFFSLTGEEPAIAVLDWQGYRCGKGAYDTAYFISFVVDPGQHLTDGIRLLRSYHSALEENGVRGYSFEQCLVDYRMALLAFTEGAVRVLSLLDFSSDRGQQLAEGVVRRMAAPLIELDAVALLPG